jgi:hypothetical protein
MHFPPSLFLLSRSIDCTGTLNLSSFLRSFAVSLRLIWPTITVRAVGVYLSDMPEEASQRRSVTRTQPGDFVSKNPLHKTPGPLRSTVLPGGCCFEYALASMLLLS